MRRLPFSEPSATIVWKTLFSLGIVERTILWNAVQLHPHRLDNLWSNRTPTPEEISLGEPALRVLIEAYPHAKVVAVGKNSERLLLEMGISMTGAIRHPANGGATKFATGLKDLM
jgi:uracil-DNA glycosylase